MGLGGPSSGGRSGLRAGCWAWIDLAQFLADELDSLPYLGEQFAAIWRDQSGSREFEEAFRFGLAPGEDGVGCGGGHGHAQDLPVLLFGNGIVHGHGDNLNEGLVGRGLQGALFGSAEDRLQLGDGVLNLVIQPAGGFLGTGNFRGGIVRLIR